MGQKAPGLAGAWCGSKNKGPHKGTGSWGLALGGLTLKVGGALEPVSEERRFWPGLSFMVVARGQVSPGSGNSSGGLRYSSSEVIGLLKGDVDPPGEETEEKQWHRERCLGEGVGVGRETEIAGGIVWGQEPDKVCKVTESRSCSSSVKAQEPRKLRRPALP